jgi:hypothetical protein
VNEHKSARRVWQVEDIVIKRVWSNDDRVHLRAVELMNLEDGLRPTDTKRAPPF